MKFAQCLLLSVLLLARGALAQTHYENLDVGAVVQGGIGMGVFSKPFPMPPGEWKVVGRTVKDIPLVNSRTKEPAGTISKYDLTLKNTEPGSMLPLMVFTVTGRLTNLDSGVKPCVSSTSKNQWVDTFSERSPAQVTSSSGFVCASTVSILNFKKFVADAGAHSNGWVKSTLSPVSSEAYTLPDNALLVSVSATRYRGYNLEVVFFVKQEASLSDAAYANHLKPWIHATGLGALAAVENNTASLTLPPPFPGAIEGWAAAAAAAAASASATPATAPPKLGGTPASLSESIQIRKSYDLLDVRPDNFRATLLNCIPQLSASIQNMEFPAPNVDNTTYRAGKGSSWFVLKKNTGLCLPVSSANYPIFATDTLRDTIRPEGVSEDVAAGWNAQIAELIARRGQAYVAYLYPNQNVMTARYWLDTINPVVIRYSTQFKAKGDWEKLPFDTIFTDSGLTAIASVNANAKGEGRRDVPF